MNVVFVNVRKYFVKEKIGGQSGLNIIFDEWITHESGCIHKR